MRQLRMECHFIPIVLDRSKVVSGESRAAPQLVRGCLLATLKGRTNLTVGRIYSPLIAYETNANPRLLPPDDMTREIDVVGLDQ